MNHDTNLRFLKITLLLACLTSLPVRAQPDLSIDWYTIDSGGGTSTGGVYSVSGTIGQPDAGSVMTGGNYALQGGFWVPIAVQVPGAPLLTIAPGSPGFATIAWEPNASGWVLQETTSLAQTNWVNSPSSSTNPITVPAGSEMKYYRLFKP